MKKRLLSVLIVLSMIFSIMPSAFAAGQTVNGSELTGDLNVIEQVTISINENGQITNMTVNMGDASVSTNYLDALVWMSGTWYNYNVTGAASNKGWKDGTAGVTNESQLTNLATTISNTMPAWRLQSDNQVAAHTQNVDMSIKTDSNLKLTASSLNTRLNNAGTTTPESNTVGYPVSGDFSSRWADITSKVILSIAIGHQGNGVARTTLVRDWANEFFTTIEHPLGTAATYVIPATVSTHLAASLKAPAVKTAPATTVTGVTVDGAAATASAVTWSANATAANGNPAAGTGTYTAKFDITAPSGVTFTEGQAFSISIDGATSARAVYKDANTASVTAVFPAITKTPESITADANTTNVEAGDSAPVTITYNDGTTFVVDANSASYASSGLTVDTSELTGGGKGKTSLTINNSDKNKTLSVTALLGTLSAVIETVKVIENAPPQYGTSAYAVYKDGTLTFKYDDPSEETGTVYTDFLSLNPTSVSDLPWNSVRNSITKVVFDRSFGYAYPSNTSYWFADCANLTEFEGMGHLVTNNAAKMSNMFAGCSKLTALDVSTLNTAKATDMSGMFKNCPLLTELDVTGFDTALAENMSSMFEGCTGLTALDISGFDTAKVTDTSAMFKGCDKVTELDISEWSITALADADEMFAGCTSLETIYSDEDTDWTGITSGTDMFDDCSALEGGNGTAYSASHKDKAYAIADGLDSKPGYFTATHMVQGAYAVYDGGDTFTFKYSATPVRERGKIYDVSNSAGSQPWSDYKANIKKVVFDETFAEAKPASTKNWFNGFTNLTSIENIENLDTSDVTDMGWMFEDCSKLESLDVTHFDTSKVTNMSEMFYGCEKLAALDVSGFDTAKVTTLFKMFEGCPELARLDVSGFDMGEVTDMSRMFAGCSKLKELNIANWNTGKVAKADSIFSGCSSLERIIAAKDTDWSGINSGTNMFENCTKLKGGAGTAYDSGKTDKTYAVTDGYNSKQGYFTATSAAQGAYAVYDVATNTLTFKYSENEIRETGVVYSVENTSADSDEIPWKAVKGDITSVTFDPSFKAARPKSTANWFNGFVNLPHTGLYGIDNLNTSETTNMSGMFVRCEKLTVINTAQFNTAKVTDMSRMFEGCKSLRLVDMAKFNTAKVTDMSQMFSGCAALESLDVTKLNTGKVTNMMAMFNGCEALKTINVSKFNIGSVTNMTNMFKNCSALETIEAGDTANWKTSTVSASTDMFTGCEKLKGAIAYDASKTDINVANNTTGYFRPIPPSAPTVGEITGETTADYGEGTTLTVNATAPANHTLEYQWYTNETNTNEGGTAIDGATDAELEIGATVGVGNHYYYCVVTAKRTDNGLSESVTSDVVTVTVGKADQTAPDSPTLSDKTNTSLTIEAITGGVNGVEYAISTSEEEPESGWTTDTTFTGLSTDTTYYIFARYKSDTNHNASPASHAAVQTDKHIHEWEYTAEGTTITVVCKNTDHVCPNTVGGTITIAAPENTVYDGNEHKAQVTNNLTTDDEITVKYEYKSWGADEYTEINGAPVSSGDYKASITLGDATVTVSYSITVSSINPGDEPVTDPEGNKLYTVGGGTVGSGMPVVPVSNVKLRIDSLDKEVVSGAYGLFQFKDIPAGKYTLTITYTDSNGIERTKDQLFEVTENDSNRIVVVPDKNVSSVVDVDESLKDVYVDKLDDVAGDLAKDEAADADVTVTLTLEPEEKDDTNEAQNEIRKLAADGSDNMDYIDVKVTRKVGNGENEVIDKADKSVRILIPFDSEKQYSVKVYHYDASTTGEAKAVSLGTDKTASEYYELTDDGYLAIVTNNFTTYAIAYDDEPAPTPTPVVIRKGGGGGGGSSSTKATPTPVPTESPEPSESPEPTDEPSPETTPEPTRKPVPGDDDWWFIDVPENEWFYEPIHYAYYSDLMYGTSEDTFEPYTDITRAMFVTVLYRMEGEPDVELDYTFTDIEKDSYYEKAVAWGSANDIIAGYSAEEYAPHQTISREQMAAILWRYAKFEGMDVSVGDSTSIDVFEDADETTEYAIPAFKWAYGSKILTGFEDNTLRPLSFATRAQASVVLGSYYKNKDN